MLESASGHLCVEFGEVGGILGASGVNVENDEAALVFAGIVALWARILAVLVAILVLFGVQWLTLQLFGTFLDAFVPVFALGLHAIAGVVSEAGGGEGHGTQKDSKATRAAWLRVLRQPFGSKEKPETAEGHVDSICADD